MRKLFTSGLALLAVACSIGYAATEPTEATAPSLSQCPPASALSHGNPGSPWVISDTYKKLGWYVSNSPIADMSTLTSLQDNTWIWVKFISNEDNDTLPNLLVTCDYDVSNGPFPRHLIVAQNNLYKDSGTPPLNFEKSENKPYYTSTYECNTSSADKGNTYWKRSLCSWDSVVLVK